MERVRVCTMCQIICDPVDCSPPGFSVRGISQARILEWAAIPLSRGIFLTQGPSLGLLHWQVDSLPRSHQGGLRTTCYMDGRPHQMQDTQKEPQKAIP